MFNTRSSVHHDIVPGAGLSVAVDQRQLAADDRRGILAGHLEDLGDHTGGCGLAVGAGDADRVGIHPLDIAQHDAALDTGDPQLLGMRDLGIARQDRRGVDQQLGTLDILGRMGDFDLDPHRPLVVDNIPLVHIAAGDGVAGGMEDLHNREHPAAADPDKVQPLDLLHESRIQLFQNILPAFAWQFLLIVHPI